MSGHCKSLFFFKIIVQIDFEVERKEEVHYWANEKKQKNFWWTTTGDGERLEANDFFGGTDMRMLRQIVMFVVRR